MVALQIVMFIELIHQLILQYIKANLHFWGFWNGQDSSRMRISTVTKYFEECFGKTDWWLAKDKFVLPKYWKICQTSRQKSIQRMRYICPVSKKPQCAFTFKQNPPRQITTKPWTDTTLHKGQTNKLFPCYKSTSRYCKPREYTHLLSYRTISYDFNILILSTGTKTRVNIGNKTICFPPLIYKPYAGLTGST